VRLFVHSGRARENGLWKNVYKPAGIGYISHEHVKCFSGVRPGNEKMKELG
jgi:hypothetical protein